MARILHGIPVGSLPEPGEVSQDDQVIAYRQSDGQAYRTDVSTLTSGGVNVLEKVYPIGSIYMSIMEINPDEVIGGQWERIENRFLLAAGSSHDAGETGGEETVALSTTNLPSHSHSLPSHTHSLPSHTHSLPSHTHSLPSHTHSTPSHTHSFSATTGSSGSHSHTANYTEERLTAGSDRRQYLPSGTDGSATFTNSGGSHTHSVSGTTGSSSGTTGSTSGTSGSTSGTSGSQSGTSGSTSGTSGSTGSGTAHNNMPPYLTVYMWQRVA